MKKHYTLSFTTALLFCSVSLYAMDWPTEDAAALRNFGFNDRGKPVLGVVFEGESEIRAAGEGEVIFSCSAADTACVIPSPLGAWTALDHGDGLISIYGRHRDKGGEQRLRKAAQGDPVAAPGISGWSRQRGFYFVLYDRRERRWVNPAMILSPITDTAAPKITGVELHGKQRQNAGNAAVRLAQGSYTIAVNAFDTFPNWPGKPLAPIRFICSVNGIEISALQLETISARDGVLLVNRNGLVPAKQVYAPFPAVEAGEVFLNRGQAQLEIIVQDRAGNAARSLSRLIVD